jgi:hypothetical protein
VRMAPTPAGLAVPASGQPREVQLQFVYVEVPTAFDVQLGPFE